MEEIRFYLKIIVIYSDINYLDFGHLISRYWPLILILIGLRILWSRRGSVDREVQIFGVHEKPKDKIKSDEKKSPGESQGTEKIVENIWD